MKAIFNNLRSMVRGPVIRAPGFLAGRTLDEALDLRDDPSFDEQWVRAHELVNTRLKYDPNAFADVEEELFQDLYSAYESTDLCACVVEDLGLLARAIAAGIEDGWLSALCLSYANGHFPTGALPPESIRLQDLVKTISDAGSP